jgi:hypothetical protein
MVPRLPHRRGPASGHVGRVLSRGGVADRAATPCGEQWHRQPCKPKCKEHRHLPVCSLTAPGRATFVSSVIARQIAPRTLTSARTVSAAASVFGQRKAKGKLTLQCPPALLELLREHRKRQAAERLRVGDSWADLDLVFATATALQSNARGLASMEGYPPPGACAGCQGPRRPAYCRHGADRAGDAYPRSSGGSWPYPGDDTERYTHVATLQMKDASERMDQALWGPDEGY